MNYVINMIFDKYPDDEMESMIAQIAKGTHEGRTEEQLLSVLSKSSVSKEDAEELYAIAKGRIKAREKFANADSLYMTAEDVRYATPDAIAQYRANQMKCDVIVDACCGTGSQAIAFAKTCKKVYAIDIDERKIRYAKKNAERALEKNITFIAGDATSKEIISMIDHADIVFCDPARSPFEKERHIEQIPFVRTILDAYMQLTKNIAIEVPPQLSPNELPFDCEKEYLSANGRLNRLTLYFGALKKHEKSAVIVESSHILYTGKKKAMQKSNPLRYLFDVDTTVIKADLVGELAYGLSQEIYILNETKKNLFLTSHEPISHPMLLSFEILKAIAPEQKKIIEELKKLDAKEIILRTEIDPKEYWNARKQYEKNLSGTKSYYLFLFKDLAIICKKAEKID